MKKFYAIAGVVAIAMLVAVTSVLVINAKLTPTAQVARTISTPVEIHRPVIARAKPAEKWSSNHYCNTPSVNWTELPDSSYRRVSHHYSPCLPAEPAIVFVFREDREPDVRFDVDLPEPFACGGQDCPPVIEDDDTPTCRDEDCNEPECGVNGVPPCEETPPPDDDDDNTPPADVVAGNPGNLKDVGSAGEDPNGKGTMVQDDPNGINGQHGNQGAKAPGKNKNK